MYSLIAIFMAMSAPVWTIALAYILGQSIGMVTMSLTSAIVVDLAPKKRLVEAYGLQRVGLNVGWAAGPAVGGYLATFLPYSWLFAAAAVITAVSLPLVKFFLKESSPKKTERFDYSAMLSVARDRMFLMFIFLSFLVFLTMGQMLSTLSIFAVDRIGLTTAQYGLLLTVNGLMVILFQYPIARLIGRFPLVRALIVGSFLYGLGYLLLGWVGGFILAAVSMVIVTAGEIIFSPSALSIVGKLSPARHRGRYMGFFGLGQTLGWTAAPLIGGILLDVFPVDYLAIWGTIALIAFLATAGFYWWGKHRPS